MIQSSESALNEKIRCPVTPWYYRRMGLLAAMLIAMGSYFFYDGKWGYHKINKIAETKEWYDSEVIGGYEKAAKESEEAKVAWLQQAREKGWINSKTLQEPRWDDYAIPFGWSSKPKKYSPDEIEQQFWWGGAMFVGAAVVGLLVLLNRNKVFIGEADRMIMPNGVVVEYAKAYKVDKRKWDNKALAYVYFREGSTEKRVTVDDLKFGGAGKVLDRLLSHFEGEIIEKQKEPEDDEDEVKSEDSSDAKA